MPTEQKLNQETIDEIFKTLLEGMKSTGNLVQEQLPLIIQEIIIWKRVETTITCILLLLTCIILSISAYRNWKWAINKDASGRGETLYIGIPISCWVLSGILLIPFFVHLHTCLMVWFAPRVYLIEYLKEFIKK